jgi:hypothetical protein
MLSWSSNDTGTTTGTSVDLGAVAAGSGAVGIPLGDELLRFASAAADLRDVSAEMGDARDALAEVAGPEFMVDAAAVAANFHMMTRLADGTGARYPAPRLDDMASTISAMGATEMVSRR